MHVDMQKESRGFVSYKERLRVDNSLTKSAAFILEEQLQTYSWWLQSTGLKLIRKKYSVTVCSLAGEWPNNLPPKLNALA